MDSHSPLFDSSPPSPNNPSPPLARFYLPGRIYHIMPLKEQQMVGSSRVCCRSTGPPSKRAVVYVSAQETFSRGIVIGASMFTDHMPANYTLQELTFPEEEDIEEF